MNLTLSVLPGSYAICRLGPGDRVPDWASVPPGSSGSSEGRFVSVTRTAAELSIVCAESGVPGTVKCDRGWRLLEVKGPLDLSLTGVLAALAAPLAEARVNIFAVATFDTDYLLVREKQLSTGIEALARAGHRVESP